MPSGKPQVKSRRTEVRKSLGMDRPSLRGAISTRRLGWGVALAALFWLGATAVILFARLEPRYRPGQLVDQPITTRVDLTWIDQRRTRARRETARDRAPSVYTANEQFFKLRQQLVTLPVLAGQANAISEVPEVRVKQFALTDAVLEALRPYQVEGQPTEQWRQWVEQLMNQLQWQAILRSENFLLEDTGDSTKLVLELPGGKREEISKAAVMINLADREAMTGKINALASRFPEAIRPSIVNLFLTTGEPSYLIDVEATTANKDAAALAVDPVQRVYRAGELIVEPSKHHRDEQGNITEPAAPLTAEQYDLLKLEQNLYQASLTPLEKWSAVVGAAFAVLLLTAGMSLLVLSLHPRVAENPMRGFALAVLLLATLGLAWVVAPSGPATAPAAAVMAALLAAVILVIAYDQPFAIGVAGIQTLLIAMALDLSIGLVLVTLAGCVVMVGQLRQIRQRGTLIRAGLVSGLVVGAGVVAAGVAEKPVVDGAYAALAAEALWGFGASVVVGFFVLGVLPFVERAFRVTTAMTLLELSDVNQPLLRRLAQAAPGTYNHSLTIAVLAEAAADAINADGLLCRVGAYYHDIGKMNKPQYFIENQGGGPNRHDKLSPAMSLLIIVGHVKDGMEMARESNLPRPLHHFIESHHGTTLVEYFYHAAQKAVGEGESQPSEFEFRYPGPKPQTREAAILMICDTVESASRTMSDPTPSRVEQLVHTLAMKRLMDGQFDESSLTLNELHRVEEAITKSLATIHHGRIKYPTDKPEGREESGDRAAG